MELKKMRVFISTPMSGKTEEEIQEAVRKAEELYLLRTGMRREDVYFYNNFEGGKRALKFEKESAEKVFCNDDGDLMAHQYSVEPKKMSVWYLGIALCNLSDCDEAFFYPEDWIHARGCRIEYDVCRQYDIPCHTAEECFDLYYYYDDCDKNVDLKNLNKDSELADLRDLIAEMHAKGATAEEIRSVVFYSMVIMDADKKHLNWKQAKADFGISALMEKYMQGA